MPFHIKFSRFGHAVQNFINDIYVNPVIELYNVVLFNPHAIYLYVLFAKGFKQGSVGEPWKSFS